MKAEAQLAPTRGVLKLVRATMLRWRHLVFGPQQIHSSAVDGRADEVQAVVGDAEVEVAEAEDEPAERRGWSLTLPWPGAEPVDRRARQSSIATTPRPAHRQTPSQMDPVLHLK